MHCAPTERDTKTSGIGFPTWFSMGWYGGLAICMFAIAVIALYTTLRKRGTTRQLAGAIVTCVVSALLLLPALAWYDWRFGGGQGAPAAGEVAGAFVYVALWGLLVPLSATVAYCLFTAPRLSSTSLPRQRTTRVDPERVVAPPARQPGIEVPYVYSADAPWGWLIYRTGNFQGQRLALKRAIITLGRSEDNDIWLDDDLASRHHAELAWANGQVYVTDTNSLNGVLVNGKRMRGSAVLVQGTLLEIGSHRFLFERAAPPATKNEQDDPLARHAGITRSSPGWAPASETPVPPSLLDLNLAPRESGDQWFTPPPARGITRDIVEEQAKKPGEDTPPSSPHMPPRSIKGPLPLRLPSKQKDS